MERFEVTILGCGSAKPNACHFPSAQIVNVHDKLYMIDCGEGAQIQMCRNHINFSRLDNIFISNKISHAHQVQLYSLPLKHRIPCCGYMVCEKQKLPHIKRDMIDFYKIPFYAINKIKQGQPWITEEGNIIPYERLTTPAD